MSKDEFREWQQSHGTRHVMKYIEAECYNMAKTIAKTAGVDQVNDNFHRGFLEGLEFVLKIDFDDVETENA